MDVREKLLDLLLKENYLCKPSECKYCLSNGSCNYYRAADRLIANGVTVQEWISVNDRLPVPFENVLVFRDGKISIDYNEGNGWFAYDFNGKRVTHWMPLPLAPTAS